MSITMIYQLSRHVLVAFVAVSIIYVSLLSLALADSHENSKTIGSPTPDVIEIEIIRAEDWRKTVKDPRLLYGEYVDGTAIYVTADGRLFKMFKDANGMAWVVDFCKIPWLAATWFCDSDSTILQIMAGRQ